MTSAHPSAPAYAAVTLDRPATQRDLSEALRGSSEEALVRLLALRPDLASPAPSSVAALAHRAASRPSVERALGGMDAAAAAVVEAMVALTGAPVWLLAPGGDDADEPDGGAAEAREADVVGLLRLTLATGLPTEEVTRVLADLSALMLTVGGRALDTLAQCLGEHPAGLGPWSSAASADAATSAADAATPAAGSPSATPGTSRPAGTPDATSPTDGQIRDLLREAPEAARATIAALLWGPPVGSVRAELPDGAQWLVDHGLLLRTAPDQVTLPREVALVAREGRTHRTAPTPPQLTPTPRPAAIVSAECAQNAAETVRLIEDLLHLWRPSPAAALRTGAVGVREVRRAALTLDVPEHHLVLLAEVAAAAGLLWRSEDDPLEWGPSEQAEDWLADDLPGRWVTLVEPWLTSHRAPWRVGRRGEGGALIALLSVQLDAPWAARLRSQTVEVLAAHPGGALTAQDVAAVGAFRHPRLPAHEEDIAHVLTEFTLLGVTGAGALAPPVRALVEHGAAAAAEELRRILPPLVEEMIVQGDLTAIVPGPPAPHLAALLELCTQVESRGAAVTVRFTEASVRRALDTGMSAGQLLEQIAGYSRAPLPQPLEYLIGDVARRHGTVRVGGAGTYLRAETTEPLLTLLGRPALAHLELRMLAPTVLVSPENPTEVARALREDGQAPVLEDAQGMVLPSATGRTGSPLAGAGAERSVTARAGGRGRLRGARRETTFPGRLDDESTAAPLSAHPTTGDDAVSAAVRDSLLAVVARARSGEEAIRRTAQALGEGAEAPDPVLVLEVLRTAASAGQSVDVVVVAGGGQTQKRRVRPLSVEGGRARLRDEQRDVDLTVAVSRIAGATLVE